MGGLPTEALTVLVGLVLLVPTINGILDIVRKAKGNPPLREELLSKYATKDELSTLSKSINDKIEKLSEETKEQITDFRNEAENRDKGIHKRINDMCDAVSATNRSIGELSGLIRGLHPCIKS